jgi:hypothetical protein
MRTVLIDAPGQVCVDTRQIPDCRVPTVRSLK